MECLIKLIQINIFTFVIVKDNTINETWGITTTRDLLVSMFIIEKQEKKHIHVCNIDVNMFWRNVVE